MTSGIMALVSVFLSFVPALLLWEYVSLKVNFRLTKKVRRKLYRVGALAVLGALVVEQTLMVALRHADMHLGTRTLLNAMIPGVTEESFDFIGLFFMVSRKELNEIGSGVAILLGTGVGLGFAVTENLLYLLGAGHQAVAMGLVRALTAIPMHAVNGMAMGAFLCLAWQDYRRTNWTALVLALAVPMVFHTAYDFLLMAQQVVAVTWPTRVEFLAMLAEGVFAAALINYAMNLPASVYGRVERVDARGRRAVGFGTGFIGVGCLMMWAVVHTHHVATGSILAAMPLLLGIDLCFTGFVRMGTQGRGYAPARRRAV